MKDLVFETTCPSTASPRALKLFHYSFSAATLFLLVGCAHNYTPSGSMKLDKVPEFSATGMITLKNAQPSTTPVLFGKEGLYKHHANYNAWTDIIIKIATRELVARGMTIKDGAGKLLELSVQSAKGTTGMGWGGSRAKVQLAVTTGDGYTQTYLGNCGSGWGQQKAAEGAVMRAVAEMLRDPKIVAYLKK